MVIIMVARSITNDLFEIPTRISGFVRFHNSYFSISKCPAQNSGTRQRKDSLMIA